MTENERIRQVRTSQEPKMSMEEFGRRLGVTKTAISLIESGRNSVSDQMRRSVVREFKVNEDWLRTGEGEMFRKQTRDEELAEFFADVLNDKPEDFRRRLVAVLAKLDVEHWKLLEEMAWKLAEIPEDEDEEEKTDS